MYTNKPNLGLVLRGIMEKRQAEGKEVSGYTFKTLLKLLGGVTKASKRVPWGYLAKFLLFSMAVASIAYGEVHYGDRVLITKGFYKGCSGVAVDEYYDHLTLKDVHCGDLVLPTMLTIDSNSAEVLK